MLQQGPEADLAAQITSCLYTAPSGQQVLKEHTELLLTVIASTTSATIGLRILNVVLVDA